MIIIFLLSRSLHITYSQLITLSQEFFPGNTNVAGKLKLKKVGHSVPQLMK